MSLPGTFGWECDGIAPRDLFMTVGANLTPGSGHNYPLFHALRREEPLHWCAPLNLWLATLGASSPVKTLSELRQWNAAR